MTGIVNFLLHTETGHFVFYIVLANAISALPAPTANSTHFYVWFFKFSNALAANFSRAYSTTLENSPNFDAVVRQIADDDNARNV